MSSTRTRGNRLRAAWVICGLTVVALVIYISPVYVQPPNQATGRRLLIKHNDFTQNKRVPNDGSEAQKVTGRSWNDPDLDLLHMEINEFLPNFKNPCWYENIYSPDIYQENGYAILSKHIRKSMVKLIQVWEYRLSKSVPARRLRCLPYFLIIGQPKCGSTDLYSKIAMHPDVVTPPIKELHWWTRNRQGKNSKDKILFQHYVDMFDEAALEIESHTIDTKEGRWDLHPLITGEGSVSTLWDNVNWWHLPENSNNSLLEPKYTNADYVHHVLPDVHLIVIMRDPTDRLYSDYLYFHKKSKSPVLFHSLAEHAVGVFRNCTKLYGIRSCVYNASVISQAKMRLHIGIYSIYLRDWLKVFARDQILFLRLEDYAEDKVSTLRRVYKFLKLGPIDDKRETVIRETPDVNKRKPVLKALGNMLPKTRRMLNKFYSVYNQQLATLLDDNRFLWNS
ncbi:hypothetical protein ScPMuIL_005748 [Solemya velum]